jgi:hypothetical protein
MRGYKSDVSFVCPKCQAAVNDTIDVPEPAWMADRASDMIADEETDITCSECDESFWAHIHVAGGECTITFNDFPDVKIHAGDGYYDGPDDDQEWYDDLFADDPYRIFLLSHRECSQYLVANGGDGLSLINRMIFAQHIAALEAYLSDTLIRAAIERKEALQALIEKDKNLLERKFSMKEFVGDPTLVKKTVAQYLKGILYHNLKQVNFLYRIVFEIDLFTAMGRENSTKLMNAIKFRHDCVHRNGKDKDDNRLDVFTKEYITEIATITHRLAETIEAKAFQSLESSQPY